MKTVIARTIEKMWTSQKGFTLMELLAVIGIVGMVSGVMSMSIIMILKVSGESNDQAIALQRVQNTGQWLSLDVQMSETIAIDTDPATETFITLTIPVAGEDDNTITYKLVDMDGTIKKLTRTDQDSGTTYLISEYIFYDPGETDTTVVSYNQDTRTLTATITAKAGDVTQSKKYQITQRIDPEPEEG